MFCACKFEFKTNRLSATQSIKYLWDDLMLSGKLNRKSHTEVGWDGQTHCTVSSAIKKDPEEENKTRKSKIQDNSCFKEAHYKILLLLTA